MASSGTQIVAGPSGGETGRVDRQRFDRNLYEKHPDLVRRIVTAGRHPRAGHNRNRWETVNWDDYRAHVGVQQRRGPWLVTMAECEADGLDAWIAEAEGLPHVPGWYTALTHTERGLVMSDLPGEIAGCLPFLDRVTGSGARILIGGLGLGIVPAWLLANAGVRRIDVVEIDPDIIELVATDAAARDKWSADPRLHVHLGDVHTCRLAGRTGCALHGTCGVPSFMIWHAAFFDIWDTVSAGNLPSMHRLHRRFARRAGWAMSWERAECEAMRRRGQTVEWPSFRCMVLEDGYA